MHDIEKGRVEHVAHLEQQMIHLKRQLDEAKPLADKWTPVIGSENTGTDLRVTLAFGGKRATVSVPLASLLQSDTTTVTSAVIDSMIKNIVFDSLVPMVQPVVQEAQRNAALTANAGKW